VTAGSGGNFAACFGAKVDKNVGTESEAIGKEKIEGP